MKKKLGKLTARQVALKYGFRSGLEQQIAQQLIDADVAYEYEKLKITYLVNKECRYTPDFRILATGLIIESKGRFTTQDRMKHLRIKKQHPELDIRFVFSNSNAKISKKSKTTYGMWCDKHGFEYADKLIPEGWLGGGSPEASQRELG